jgi:hypothetical protein
VGGALEVTHAVLNGDAELAHDDLCDTVGRLLASSIQRVALDTTGAAHDSDYDRCQKRPDPSTLPA